MPKRITEYTDEDIRELLAERHGVNEACRWLKNEGDVGVRELAAITGLPPYVVCFAMGMKAGEGEAYADQAKDRAAMMLEMDRMRDEP